MLIRLVGLLLVGLVFLGRLVIGLLLLAVIAVWVRAVYRKVTHWQPPAPEPCPVQPKELPVVFRPVIGYKTAWLAVREESPSLVINALGLTQAEAFDWSADLNQVGEQRRVFVSPGVNGWVQIIGMPNLFDRPKYLEYIANRFREVQFFITHRVVEYHGWAKYVDCRLVRRYCWVGESGQVLFNDGPLTPEEAALGFDRFPQSDDVDWDRVRFPDEADVNHIAAAWGAVPALDEGEPGGSEPGYLCSLPEWVEML